MAGYSYPDKVLESFEKLQTERLAGVISTPPAEPLEPGEEGGKIPQKLLARGTSGPMMTRDEYIQTLKVKSAVEAIAQFREDVHKKVVPGDADDVGMAAYMVYRLMVRQAAISRTHGYFMPAPVKEGMAWLQAGFNIGPGAENAAGSRGSDSPKRSLAGSWGIPQDNPRADVGTVEDANPSNPIASIIEAEMREKYPDMFKGVGPVDATGARQRRQQPPDNPARAPAGERGGAFSTGYATSRGSDRPAEDTPGADTELPFAQGSPSLRGPDQKATDPTAGSASPASGVAGLNETLSKLSSGMGGESSSSDLNRLLFIHLCLCLCLCFSVSLAFKSSRFWEQVRCLLARTVGFTTCRNA